MARILIYGRQRGIKKTLSQDSVLILVGVGYSVISPIGGRQKSIIPLRMAYLTSSVRSCAPSLSIKLVL